MTYVDWVLDQPHAVVQELSRNALLAALTLAQPSILRSITTVGDYSSYHQIPAHPLTASIMTSFVV